MRVKGSKALIFSLKLLVSVLLVTWIVKDVDFYEIGEVLKHSNIPLLIFAFCMYFVGYVLTAIRWRLLISIQAIQILELVVFLTMRICCRSRCQTLHCSVVWVAA